ncbi:MAG TPA: immunoglobulin domain-containing protein, partial [Candidatus Limnocylindria bacterium]|nr:immunoglobulin domain-containing protein [Candidatus Limnocylindria bacterium]
RETISGEVDWRWRSWPVTASGSVVLEWRYIKDDSAAAGQDAGWVDEVYWVPSSTPTLPIIAIQPTNRAVVAPANVNFSAIAAGSTPLGYQWFFNDEALANGAGISGVTATNLVITGAGAAHAGEYYVVVTNSAGSATSAVVSLTAIAAPIIARQPASQSVLAGSTVNVNFSALGSAPMVYQWLSNGTNLSNAGNVSGVTTTNLRLTSILAAQAGEYSVIVSNASGSVTSEVATVLVGVSPTFDLQPASRTVVSGSNVTLTTLVSGTAPFGYRWRVNGTNVVNDGINGANTADLTIANVQPGHAGSYSVVVTNKLGSITSTNAVLTVLLRPAITTQPASQNVPESANVTFNVAATGTGPLTYRWRRNGTNLANGGSFGGTTTPTLTVLNAQLAQSGAYSVLVSNTAGTVVSASAQLTVIPAMTLGEALNAPYLEWNTDIAVPWTIHTNMNHDGQVSARSGSITNGGTTWVETTVTGPGTIRFWWKTSSQTNADILSFTVNGSEWASISGLGDWQKVSFGLPGGPLVLRWNYTKNATVTNGLDRAWLDEVDFTPAVGPSAPVIVRQPVGKDIAPDTTVAFSIEAVGSGPLSYQWRFEGQDLEDGGNIQGANSTALTVLNAQVAHGGVYDVIVRNPYSSDQSEQIYLDVIPIIPLNTALDTDHTNLIWITSGFSQWIGQKAYNQDRIDAAQSTPLPDNTNNWIQTIVSGPGAISFWWKVSSATNQDRLRFTADGVELANISGEVDWRQRTFFIAAPNTELRWIYSKDSSGKSGQDRGWVDIVEFLPSSPVITNSGPDSSIVDQGTTMKFSVDASGTPPFSYQWRLNGTNLVNSDPSFPIPGMIVGASGSHNLYISNVQPWQAGSYVCEVYNSAGSAFSEDMTLEIIPAMPITDVLNTNVVWETGGDAWWVGTTNAHDGVMAARNGTLLHGRSTWMRTTVQGPNTLKFWWRASTETNADYMTFSINGVEEDRISGNHNWEQKVIDLNGIGT